ncbi:MAG TPA: Flp family type IVb pilin [Gemmatimonadaceae bacterium]|nr:Flp family type IVb pilin [Gemmatimonadaceae bacterium]
MDTDAVTMVEYALMICMCALVAVAAISTLGVRLGSRYDAAAGILSAAAGRHPRGCDAGNGSAASKNPNC